MWFVFFAVNRFHGVVVVSDHNLGSPCLTKIRREGVLGFVAVRVVQSLRRVRVFATPWTAARQASLSLSVARTLHQAAKVLVRFGSASVLSKMLVIPEGAAGRDV